MSTVKEISIVLPDEFKDITEVLKIYKYRGRLYLNVTSHIIRLYDDENGVNFNIMTSGVSIKVKSKYIEIEPRIYKVVHATDPKYSKLINWISKKYPNIIILGSILTAQAYRNIYALKIVDGLEKFPRSEKMAYWDKFIIS